MDFNNFTHLETGMNARRK